MPPFGPALLPDGAASSRRPPCPGDLVIDPAAGGFSTLEAALACAEPRAFLGTDLPA